MLRRGELAYVVAGRKIDPASVREHLDGAYARLLLDVVLGGEFEVPAARISRGQTRTSVPGMLGLAFQTGFAVPEDEIEPLMDELARIARPGAAGLADGFRGERTERSSKRRNSVRNARFIPK